MQQLRGSAAAAALAFLPAGLERTSAQTVTVEYAAANGTAHDAAGHESAFSNEISTVN